MRKSFLAILVIYGLLLAGTFYWQVCADLENHPANPRYYLMFTEDRGAIFDRYGQPLATSSPDGEIYSRTYVTESLSHVVGYFHQRYGMTGIERLYHEELTMGRSLFTTLDLELQRAAESALSGKTGAIIAINPATGEVLSLVSSPGIDSNMLDEHWSDYLADLRSPFLNRATHGLYPPGSVIKPIGYAAAVEQDLAWYEQTWQDEGVLSLEDRTIGNFGGNALGMINIDQALAYSSNVVFAQLAISLQDDLLHMYRRFGLGREIDFELRNLQGVVPAKSSSDYDAAQLGIGQGKLLVTPLQMAVVAATIANEGVMMRPYLVHEVRGGVRMRQITRPQIINTVILPNIAEHLRKAMILAATEGTARTSFTLDYGAKTGTAQTNQGQDHAWFIGFAPTTDPQVAVAVVIEHGGMGSQAAAPVGAQVMSKAVQRNESQR